MQRIHLMVLVLVGSLFWTITSAHAGELAGLQESGGIVSPLLRLLLALGVVLLLAYASIHFFKRLSTRRVNGGSQLMKVLEVLPLGAKTRLVAVRVGQRVLLVGAGDDRVTTVAELTASEFDAAVIDAAARAIPFKDRGIGPNAHVDR